MNLSGVAFPLELLTDVPAAGHHLAHRPILDAAHIKPYSESGQHIVKNGILMRRDLHALFDKGYVTITPSMQVEVSRRIKEEFENGRDYYRLQGSKIQLPASPVNYPSREYLDWHNSNIYRG